MIVLTLWALIISVEAAYCKWFSQIKAPRPFSYNTQRLHHFADVPASAIAL